jgi:DNA transposition AAA+ family ATPase
MDLKNELKTLMQEKKYSFQAVARATAVSSTTLNLWINDNYNGKSDKIADVVNNFINREKERNYKKTIPCVETSIFKRVFEIARMCHINGEIGVCYGRAGLGKTIAAKEYIKHYLDSILIETDPGFNTKALLTEFHKRLGLSNKGNIYKMTDEVIQKLRNSGRLIIIDEAENLPYKALELVRRIHDKTEVGILLSGLPALVENLRGKEEKFEQLYSRVGVSKRLENLNIEDIELILESLSQDKTLSEAYYKHSMGNTRVLSKLIMRTPRVAQINKIEVTPEIIEKTSKILIV